MIEFDDALSALVLGHLLQLLLAFRGQPIVIVLRFLQLLHRLVNLEDDRWGGTGVDVCQQLSHHLCELDCLCGCRGGGD